MAVSGRGRCQLLAAVLLITIHQATNAPVTDDTTSHALQLAEPTGDVKGCYYNFEHYDEGDRILTNEPCLNCTCHNKMLMCYLRVCPFTKAIGQDCTVEKKPDQCCPIITCPQVHVALLTSSTTSETPPTTTALGRPDSYGCILEDNTFYPDGAQVPSDLRKPCELCYCIRNQTACVMQECTLNVEGCKPVYQEGVCCPVRYDCDYDEVATTPKPVGLVTTPGGTSDCLHNGVTYRDGEMVTKDLKAPCEHCYCMRGDIVCAVQECGTPLEGRDCTPLSPSPGQCCPNYQCANGTNESVQTSTEKLEEEVTKDSIEEEKPDTEEHSNESDNSSEESQEVLETESPNVSGGEEGQYQEGHQSINEPIETTTAPQQPETSSVENIKSDETVSPSEEKPDDSHSEATQHEESESQVVQEPSKDPQVTNEIPALPAHDIAMTTTEEPPQEAARIPGEGSCLVEGKTYSHNAIVPTENPCQEICRCFSSIVRCNPRDCPPAPSPDENCIPVTTPGSCCPTYMCDQKTSDAPVVQDHKIDDTHQEESSNFQEVHQSTLPPEELPVTEAPAIMGFPPESLVPGGQEHGDVTSETDAQQEENSQHSSEDNSQVNSNIVHDASLHGGHSGIDSHENGNVPHSAGDLTTTAPENSESASQNEKDQVNLTQSSDDESASEQEINKEEQPQTESPILNHDEDSVQVNETESQPSESDEHKENINQEIPHEPEHSTEQIIENVYQSETNEGISSPEETKNEDSPSTNSPIVPSVIVDDPKTEIPIESEHSHSDVFDKENTQVHDNEDAEHISSSEELQHIPDIPTTVPPAPEVEQPSHGEEHMPTLISEHVTTENLEHTPTENPEEHSGIFQNQHVDDETVPMTTIAPEVNQVSSSTETVEKQPINLSEDIPEGEKESQVNEKPNVSSSEEQTEYPTTEKSFQEETVSETEVAAHSESVENDSVPDSSQSIETAEHADKTGSHEQGSENEEGHVKDSEKDTPVIQDNLNEPTTPSPVAVEQDNTQTTINNKEQPEKTTEPAEENKDSLEEVKHPVIPEEEQQKETTSIPIIKEEETLPEKHVNLDNSQDTAQHEFSTIIYEEVKVTGMPSIESHVTEGTTTDHSISHQDASHHAGVSTSESQEIHIPGPEGIVTNISENQASEQNTVTAQTEENVNTETKPSEGLANNEKIDSHETTDNQHPETSPEIIKEIDEKKESLNQITSDNTAQLIEDINQIIQNEVNNQLFHGGHQTDESTNEDSHKPPMEKEPESVDSQDHVRETTVTPPAENSKPDETEESLPGAEDVHNDVSQVGETENPKVTEKEPVPISPEETPAESEVGTTNAPTVINLPTHDPSTISHQEDMSTEQPIHENAQDNSEETDEVPPHESIENIHKEQEKEDTRVENMPTTTETHKDLPTLANESEGQKTNDNKEIASEQDVTSEEDKKKPETGQVSLAESTVGASPEVVSQVTDDSQEGILPAVSEDQNAIPEDVTHIISTVSQVPDSANQVLEDSSGDYENVPSTEQSALKPESEVPAHGSEESNVPNEENTVSEGNNEQNSESDHHEEIPHHEVPSQETFQPQPEEDSSGLESEDKVPHEEIPVTQETPLDHNVETEHNEETSPEVHEETVSETHKEESSEYQTESPVEHHDEISSQNNEETSTEYHEAPQEHHLGNLGETLPSEVHSEAPIEHTEPPEQEEIPDEHKDTQAEINERPSEIHTEAPAEHQTEIESEHHEPGENHEESSVDHNEETTVEHHEASPIEHHEGSPAEQHVVPDVEHHEESSADHHEESPVEHHEKLPVEHHEEPPVEHHGELTGDHHEEPTVVHHEEIQTEQSADISHASTESSAEDSESSHSVLDQVHQVVDSEKQETVQEHQETPHEPASEHSEQETTSEHQGNDSSSLDTSSPNIESNEDKDTFTVAPAIESSSEPHQPEDHVSTEGVETQKHDEPTNSHLEGSEHSSTVSPQSSTSEIPFSSSTEHEAKPMETQGPDFTQNIHSTEMPSLSEILSSTQKPIEEQNPLFPTWSQKPIEHHTTAEPHPPEENPYPTGFDSEYEDEEGVSYGPGTCRYGGKVYLSAQQIPRDDPCDFCFCFRSDIICLQQSCPPPIRGCYQETIKGFCCPRYECHVSMATMVNITTTTTTTTTTVPPLFFAHAYNGAATKAGCQVKGVAYHVGEKIPSTSGPCLECRCGANGQMKCDPTVCGPQEALLRQVMDAAVSRKRR